MFLRLILTLMLALGTLTAPVAAPCHDVTAGPMAMAGHSMPGIPEMPDKATPAHLCVGCIPPSNWAGARVAAPIASPQAVPMSRVARLDLARAGPPALPPPRLA